MKTLGLCTDNDMEVKDQKAKKREDAVKTVVSIFKARLRLAMLMQMKMMI